MRTIISRWQKRQIIDRMKKRRVILLTGPRQCGKTTLAQSLDNGAIEYRTLDDDTLLQAALADPQGFVQHKKEILIIDEVQKAPKLLPAIKMVVDLDPRPGQFLLTGSTNLNAIPSASESLAGRISKIRLRPLTQAEVKNATPEFLERAYSGDLEAPTEHADREELLNIGFRGGYPEAMLLDQVDRQQWHEDYLTAILERDLKDVARIHRVDAMRKLIEVTAAWSSKLMAIAGITSKLSIKRPTVESYLAAIEALYLIDRIPAWTKTDYDRVGKQDKLFMTDSGLMASILDWRLDQIRFDADRSGKFIETLAYTEIAAMVDALGGYKIYHYRDRQNREIDLLIERRGDGALLGIEVKASASVSKSDFKHLIWFQEHMEKDRAFNGIVLYSGNRVLSFGDGLTAVPFSTMWNH